MEDRNFELLTQFFAEFKEFKAEVKQGFTEVNKKLDEKAAKQDIARLETELKNELHSLQDGYVQNTERLTRVEDRLETIESTIKNKSIVIGKDYYVQLFPKDKEPA